MIKKAASHLAEHDLTKEVASSPVGETKTELEPECVTETESQTVAKPVIEAEVVAEDQPDEGDKDRQDVKSLELKMAELEDKLVKLQTEIDTLLNKKNKKKRDSKGKKVKCKCKDKKVDIAKCKCKSKKSDK